MVEGSEFFRALSLLAWHSEERESEHENLMDILESVAVLEGLKPAHLNGQGLHSDSLIGELELTARKFGLLTLRTQGLSAYYHRQPSYDPEIFEWERQDSNENRKTGKSVLWIYRNAELSADIHRTVEGSDSCSGVLGYPECCVHHNVEEIIVDQELLINGLMREFGACSSAQIIDLLIRDV